MFGKGNWAVFGIDPAQLATFKSSLANADLLLRTSQFAASALTRTHKMDTHGINPYGTPRLDEKRDPEALSEDGYLQLVADVAAYTLADAAARSELNVSPAVETMYGGPNGNPYQITGGTDLYGFWLVENKWKDVTDLAAKREGLAYDRCERPFKFLSKGEKDGIEAELKGEDAAQRKQYAVLLDFQAGRVYVECTNAKTIAALRLLLADLGVDAIDMAWQFGDSQWPFKFLNYVRDNSHYKSEFQQRADEYKYHAPEQIEALEDKMLEGVVSDFFSTAQLETELWASLGTPAVVQIAPTCPITVQSPPTATFILNHVEEAVKSAVVGSAVSFQRVGSYFRKEVEIVYRRTLLKMVVDEKMNELDAGAALLRGFDLPGFSKSITKALKGGEAVDVAGFWYRWFSGMREGVAEFAENVRVTLGIDRDEPSGLLPMKYEVESGDSEVKI